ncbi:AAA family ATPase [Actinokineospora sp. HBU206404]|uniref:AAA family ATPase n=1 Tax=Actinokineospora xionganensis TaxID=2684470 RepID=A0ABR7L5K2_9PSEU|nr:AAA family ATPase [Actinokineospora xionganensis]
MIGRSDELENLFGAFRRLDKRGRTAGLAVVTGDAGIGKTSLLAEFAALVQSHGAVIRSGRAIRGTATGPAGILGDALDDHDHTQDDDAVDPRGVRALLTRLAGGALVVILDDCHLASPAALRMLGAMLRKPPSAPVLFVLCFRDRQTSAGLRSTIQDRSRHLPITQVHLGPLTERDMHRMLADQGTTVWRRNLYRESGGNPGYLHALLSARTVKWQNDPIRGAHRVAYDDSAGFIAEFDGISAEAKATADAGAVIGDDFDLDLLTAVVDLPESDVLAGIDELIGRDLVRPLDRGRCFAFRHPVVRRAVYQHSELCVRISLHAKADEVLRARGATPAERATHVQHGIRHGDLEGVKLLTEAAKAVVATQPLAAEAWLRTALRALPSRDDTMATRAMLLVARAKALGTIGRLRDCRQTLLEAMVLLPPDARDLRGEAVAALAAVERLLGTHGSADAVLRAEIEARGDDFSAPSAALRLEIAHTELVKGDPMACRWWAREALAMARREGDRALEASSLGLMGKADGTAGNGESAAAHLAQATAILDMMLDDEHTASLDAAVWIGWSEILLVRWYDAARHFDRAVDRAVRADNGLVLPQLLLGQVLALHARGRLVDASEAARNACHLAESSGSQGQLFAAKAMLAWASAGLGTPDKRAEQEASAMVQDADAVVGWQSLLALRMLAETKLAAGDPQGCLDLVPAAGGPNLPGSNPCSRVSWYELMTRAELEAGNPEAAAKWAELAVSAGMLLDHPGRSALGHLAMAQLLLATDPLAALARAEDAVEGLAATGAIFDELRARVVLGMALWHAGRRDDAQRELRAARAGLERIGATPWAKRAELERRRLITQNGQRATENASDRPAVLTRREQQIADLVRDGLTNRQIARKLHIAEKTVEMHLTNVFAKLGVGNRAGVAAHVSDHQARSLTV